MFDLNLVESWTKLTFDRPADIDEEQEWAELNINS